MGPLLTVSLFGMFLSCCSAFYGAAAVAGKRRDASVRSGFARVWERAGSQSRPHRFLMRVACRATRRKPIDRPLRLGLKRSGPRTLGEMRRRGQRHVHSRLAGNKTRPWMTVKSSGLATASNSRRNLSRCNSDPHLLIISRCRNWQTTIDELARRAAIDACSSVQVRVLPERLETTMKHSRSPKRERERTTRPAGRCGQVHVFQVQEVESVRS